MSCCWFSPVGFLFWSVKSCFGPVMVWLLLSVQLLSLVVLVGVSGSGGCLIVPLLSCRGSLGVSWWRSVCFLTLLLLVLYIMDGWFRQYTFFG